jgi:hypothetical protein
MVVQSFADVRQGDGVEVAEPNSRAILFLNSWIWLVPKPFCRGSLTSPTTLFARPLMTMAGTIGQVAGHVDNERYLSPIN